MRITRRRMIGYDENRVRNRTVMTRMTVFITIIMRMRIIIMKMMTR